MVGHSSFLAWLAPLAAVSKLKAGHWRESRSEAEIQVDPLSFFFSLYYKLKRKTNIIICLLLSEKSVD